MSNNERLPHCGMTRAEVSAKVAKSRAGQGLPRYIEDPVALQKIATILVSIPTTATTP